MSLLRKKAREFSNHPGDCSELEDEANRIKKAKKIRAVLAEYICSKDASLRILDLGCSYGIILNEFKEYAKLSVGVDLDINALKYGAVPNTSVCSDAEVLPFNEKSFDLIICNHVYEHTENASKLMEEIFRVLSTDGCCYFAGPNKYSLIEPHYELPFLSWMPQPLADVYIKITKGLDSYNVRPFSYSRILDLTKSFKMTEYTEMILRDPEQFHAENMVPKDSMKQKIAIFIYKYMRPIFPDFIFLLRKEKSSTK